MLQLDAEAFPDGLHVSYTVHGEYLDPVRLEETAGFDPVDDVGQGGNKPKRRIRYFRLLTHGTGNQGDRLFVGELFWTSDI